MLKYIVRFFVLASIIELSSEVECGIVPVTSAIDCFTRESTQHQCCLITTLTNNKFCRLFDRTKDPSVSDGETLTCFEDTRDSDLLGSPCGDSKKPVNPSDCTQYTNNSNPCCFYRNNITNESLCFKLGKITQSSLITYDNTLINCNANIFSYSFYLLINLILLFI